MEFEGADSAEFEIPYLLCDLKDVCSVEFFPLDDKQTGKITFSEFNAKYSFLTIIPFIKNKTSGFDGREDSFSFSWKVTVQEKSEEKKEAELISLLLSKIEELKRQIAEAQAKINAILIERGQISCQRFEKDLFFGIRNDFEVRCLQEFLKSQGQDVYPEGLVTGNFLFLTKLAVIRFQERYAAEILAPLSLEKGTGYVGQMTRTKLNELLISGE